jgi:hypothetical protein
MPVPESLDREKLAEAALAILSLSAFDDGTGSRAWKNLDWDLMDLLHEHGWIHDPKNRAKSVALTDEGLRDAAAFLEKYFGRTPS